MMLEFSTYIRNKASAGFPADLEVRIHVFRGWGVGPRGEMLVTPWLISDQEVDHSIDEMIKGLEAVRAEAKSKLEENR